MTQSMEQLWELHADRSSVFLNAFEDCENEGFPYYDSEYRWPAACRSTVPGRLWARVPQGGDFYLGAVIYDGPGAEHYVIGVNEEAIGRFSAEEDNNRQKLYFWPEPLRLSEGDTVQLLASQASEGRTSEFPWVTDYIVEDLVLLADAPSILRPPREIRHFEFGYDRHLRQMRATWVTTWPTVCRLTCGGEVVEESGPLQNHRLYLPELSPGQEYEAVVTTTAPDGTELTSPTVTFTAEEPAAPQGTVTREQIELAVLTGGRDCPPSCPLTAGMPFGEGELGSTDNLRVVDDGGGELSLQAKPLSWWPDGSIKVALIDCMAPAEVADREFGSLLLEYGSEVSRTEPSERVTVEQSPEAIVVSSGQVRLEFRPEQSGLYSRAWYSPDGQFDESSLISGGEAPPQVTVVGESGDEYTTLGPVEDVEVEEDGPLRAVVRLDGHHSGPDGQHFAYRTRVTLYAGLPWITLSYRWENDRSEREFAKFQSIKMHLPVELSDGAGATIGGDEPISGAMDAGLRLAQLHDDSYTAVSPAGEAAGKRAPGWLQVSDERRSVRLIGRHFWQLYPKALSTDADGVVYEICPDFPEGQYDDCSQEELIKLYYYLQDGCYSVRQGVSKVHDVLLAFGDAAADARRLSELTHRPILLAARPEWYANSGVFGEFVTKTSWLVPRYDAVCDRAYDAHMQRRATGREYGMLNFGDRFGERRVNWFNGEYDYHHVAAQMFVRSAEAKWHELMLETARHHIDVDTCHYHENPRLAGAQWRHAIGHTGGYFHRVAPPETLVSHAWCEGTCEYYWLTGEPGAIEAARMTADHYAGSYINNYDFTNCRLPGWHLILTLSVYRATGDPYYLNAAQIIVDRVLERRTPDGGWDRQLTGGHCQCSPRCRGACGFMVGILGRGLDALNGATEDARLPTALHDAAEAVVAETWMPACGAFRYTSCPNSFDALRYSWPIACLLDELGPNDATAASKQRADLAWERSAGYLTLLSDLRWAFGERGMSEQDLQSDVQAMQD